MGNNFNKIIVIHKGNYYEIDRKPEFHQAACKHKYIKGQIVRTMGDLAEGLAKELEKKGRNKQGQRMLKLSKEQYWDKQPIGVMVENMLGNTPASKRIGSMAESLMGRLPKSVNLCKKCGKVKIRNN